MTQLSYHPAYDAYHCIFRITRTLLLADQTLRDETLQICEFFLLFPNFIPEGKWPQGTRKTVTAAAAGFESYGQLPPPTALFRNTRTLYAAALNTLVSKGIVARQDPLRPSLGVDTTAIPEDLAARAAARNAEEPDVVKFIEDIALTIPVEGRQGLKARSGLMEHRYDPV